MIVLGRLIFDDFLRHFRKFLRRLRPLLAQNELKKLPQNTSLGLSPQSDICTPKKIACHMFPVRMLLIRLKNSKGKYQNGSLTSSNLPKKFPQKSHIPTDPTLYRASHSEDLRILDLQSISIGFHTVKMFDFWGNFFGEITEVRESFWYFYFEFFLRIKSIRPV